MAIADKLQQIIDNNTAIKGHVTDSLEAVAAKGVEVPSGSKVENLPTLIESIEQGGSGEPSDEVIIVGEGALRVRFIDPIKGLFRIHYVNKGDPIDLDQIPPLTHDRLTFEEWIHTNESLDNIQGNVDVGAIYTTTSGKIEIDYTVSEYEGSTLTLALVSDDADITVEWGDGQVTEGLSDLQPPNPIPMGSYTMLISCPNEVTASTSSSVFLMGDKVYNTYITAVRFGGNILDNVPAYMFQSCKLLRYCTIPYGFTSILTYAFAYSALEALIAHKYSGVAGICNSCNNLQYVVIAPVVNNYASWGFKDCLGLTEMILPQISWRIYGSFTGMSNLFLVDLSTWDSVCSLQPTTSIPDNDKLKIIVPIALLEDFKTATNWSYFSDKMIGI